MSMRSILVLLAGLNLALLGGLFLLSWTPPEAAAQGIGRGTEYVLVAAQAELRSDAVYLFDLRTRQMHAFRSTFPRVVGQPVRVALMNSRDLNRDFGTR